MSHIPSRVFFFHYNKPASKQAGRPRISVHWNKTCYIVDNVECDAPIKGHINKRQPYFVMKGLGVVYIVNFGQHQVARIHRYSR
jgi:hypothetical protein